MSQSPTQSEQWQELQAMTQAADAMSRSLLLSLSRQYLDIPFQDAKLIQPLEQPGEISKHTHFLRVQQVGNSLSSLHQPLMALQTTLSACHDPGRYTLLFIIAHDGDKNRIYLGVRSRGEGYTFVDSLRHFLRRNWPGTRLQRCEKEEIWHRIENPLSNQLRKAIALTGIPSLKVSNRLGYSQSLDRMLYGLHGQPFMYMVIAEPMSVERVNSILSRCRTLAGEIHTFAKVTLNQMHTQESSVSKGLSQSEEITTAKEWSKTSGGMDQFGGSLDFDKLFKGPAGMLLKLFPPMKLLSATQLSYNHYRQHSESVGGSEAIMSGFGWTQEIEHSFSQAKQLGREYINFHASHAEQYLQHYIKRFEQGRAQGAWNVGVYLLADNARTVQQGAAQLRALLSGKKSFFEPIRDHNLESVWLDGPQSVLSDFAQPSLGLVDSTGKSFDHPLGPAFNGLTTPLNTEELALLVNLPQREVPGVPVMPSADFSLNPPLGEEPGIALGELLESGESTNKEYTLSLSKLAKPILVTGMSGSGKSTTCRQIVNQLKQLKQPRVPFLIIETAKDEYVECAIAHNKKLAADSPDRIAVYMPALPNNSWRGHKLESLHLNPFDVIWLAEDVHPVVLPHIDRMQSILNAIFPMPDALSIYLENLLFEIYERGGWLADQPPAFETPRPTPTEIIERDIEPVIRKQGYDANLTASLVFRLKNQFEHLRRGWRKQLFDQPKSTNWAELFDRPAVINLSYLTDTDKTFTMAVLLQFLYEYRQAKHVTKPKDKQLHHLTLIESADHLLRSMISDNPERTNQKPNVAEMFSSIMADIGAYGEGLLIVAQSPAKLVPEAIDHTSLKIVHRLVKQNDRDVMANSMALTNEQSQIIVSLRPGQAIVFADQDDMASWVQIPKKK